MTMGLVLSLAPLASASAAPKKAAKPAETRKAAAPKAAGSKASVKAPASSKKEAAKRETREKATSKVAAKSDAKAGKNQGSKRAVAQKGKDRNDRVAAKGRDRVKVVQRVDKGRSAERAERMAARETRLPLRSVAQVQREAPAPRLSMGQMIGLHAGGDALALKSSVALVLDQDSHEVLFSKNDHAVLPIASLTKLMTGLIVSDARLPLDEMITITEADVDYEKGSSSRLPVGTTLTRGELMHLALMSSENRAAHALGRTYPGGMSRFVSLMNAKAVMLGMKDTRYVEPTGLSSANRSSAYDLATLVSATAQDPLLRQLTTSTGYEVAVGNRVLQYNNTNRLVHSPDWQIGLQKTGYISEAGQCLVMQARVAGRKLIMVFLDSAGKYSRIADAERVRRWVEDARPATVAGNGYAG